MNSPEKYIGIIKWFRDEARDANYGFIIHEKLGDLFFHERNSAERNITIHQEGQLVVFNIKMSDRHKGKYEAVNVINIVHETDLVFLFTNFLESLTEKGKYSDSDKLQKGVYERVLKLLNIGDYEKPRHLEIKAPRIEGPNILGKINLDDINLASRPKKGSYRKELKKDENDKLDTTTNNHSNQPKFDSNTNNPKIEKIFVNDIANGDIFEIYKTYLLHMFDNGDKVSIDFLEYLLNICKSLFNDKYQYIITVFLDVISDSNAHTLWLDGYTDVIQQGYLSTLFIKNPLNLIDSISKRVSPVNSEQLFLILFQSLNQISDTFYEKETSVESLINFIKKYFSNNNYSVGLEIIIKRLKPEHIYYLWVNEYIIDCPVIHISKILDLKNEYHSNKILLKCTQDDKYKIFNVILLDIGKSDPNVKYELLKNLLIFCRKNASNIYENIVNDALSQSPDYIKMQLWIEDFHQFLDFERYKIFLGVIDPHYQKLFTKKVLKYIHEGHIKISIKEFTSLNVADYETSQLAKAIDNSKIDYSTSIILTVINELSNQVDLSSKSEQKNAKFRIYDLILKQIKEPADILQITGYFDECTGRCKVEVTSQKDEEDNIIGREIILKRYENIKPKNHVICDGRKAINSQTLKPILSEEYNVEYWWCANQKCYKPSRELHTSDEWQKYSLLDFLTILQVPFRESDLELYLNIINKANRFLNHLKCRSCNHILYPKGKSQYAFYGINNFSCTNQDCREKGTDIYISHCLNGYCEMEIDSRDNVKCKPEGHDSEICGWYVCNNCNACCSKEQLEKRKWVYEKLLHKEYKCHVIGHRELGILSCNNCGNPMDNNSFSEEKYKKTLKWFLDNKDKDSRIYKSGKNSKGKWWFLFSRGTDSNEVFKERLSNCRKQGFSVPDIDIVKDLQLISEPQDLLKGLNTFFTCKSCGHVLDLSSSIEKAIAVRHYHNVIFKNSPIV